MKLLILLGFFVAIIAAAPISLSIHQEDSQRLEQKNDLYSVDDDPGSDRTPEFDDHDDYERRKRTILFKWLVPYAVYAPTTVTRGKPIAFCYRCLP